MKYGKAHRVTATGLIVSVALAGFALTALADTDYQRIKKDIRVMSGILKDAFKRQSQRVTIDANYLASQGAVFNVSTRSSFSFNFNSDDDENVFVVNGNMLPELPEMPELSGLPGDFVADIQIALEDQGISWFSGEADGYETRVRIDRETRAAIREVSREIRDVEREISEYRLELIHVDEPDDRKELDQQVAELDKRLAEVQEKRTRLEQHLETEQTRVQTERAKMKEQALAARSAQMNLLQTNILQSLCDYGSTLKNLPDREHISVIIGEGTDAGERKVFVFDKLQVTECKSGADGLAKQATSYMF